MKENYMKQMQATSYLSGVNAAYIEELYEAFLKDRNAVIPHWRNYFEGLLQSLNNGQREVSHADIRDYFARLAKSNGATVAAGVTVSSGDIQKEKKQAKVAELVNAYRSYGHHRAKLDPLNMVDRWDVAELNLVNHGLTEADLNTVKSI